MKPQVLLIGLLALSACNDKDKVGGAAESAPSATKAASKQASPFKIEKFGLLIDLPSDTEASTMGDIVMLQAPGSTSLSIGMPGEFAPKTLAEAVTEAEMYGPLNLVKAEVEGGWDMTFENKGSAGANYWVKVRRTIDGKDYTCEVTSPYEEHQTAGLAACKTLRK